MKKEELLSEEDMKELCKQLFKKELRQEIFQEALTKYQHGEKLSLNEIAVLFGEPIRWIVNDLIFLSKFPNHNIKNQLHSNLSSLKKFVNELNNEIEEWINNERTKV